MKKKYPFVKQDDLKDCAVASLLMIIRFYNGNISISKLREMMNTSKNGTSAYHLIEAARMIGFKATGIRLKIEDFNDNLILPCIAHVTINDIYYHYVVIYEINFNKKQLWIADPAYNIKKMSFEQFNKIYNNIIITLYPKKKIPIYYKEKSFYHYGKEIIMKNKKTLFIVMLLSLFTTLFSIINSFYFQISLQNILNQNILFKLFLLFLIFEISKNIFLFIRNQIFIYLNKKITKNLFSDTFSKIILLPYQYYRNRTSGEIVTRINDLNIVKETINEFILTFLVDIMLTIVATIILYHINLVLLFVSILFLLIYSIVFFIFKPIIYRNLNKVKTSYTNMNSYLVESLTGFETIKGLGIETNVIDKLNAELNCYVKDQKKLDNISNIEQIISHSLNGSISIIIIFLGSILLHNQKIELGSLISFIFILNYFLEPIKNILNLVREIEEAKLSYRRISEIINNRCEKKLIKQEQFNNIIVKEHPTLYNDHYFLKDQIFKIKRCEKIAIIGQSGSGKSTLLKLIKNYYNTNNVLVGTTKLNQISKKDIDQNIIYLSQNEILFTDTLYNNICLHENIDQKKFHQVISDCYIDDIIKNNSLNYYMLIEENGFNLSGGEKQRIVLARALLKKANYLLIDEGLNQVDVSLERKILKNILKHHSKKTILFVTHRNNNIDLFDRVIKMDNGNMIENLTRNRRKEVV